MYSNFCLLFALINLVSSAKILVWMPVPSVSHQVIGYPIVKELSLRGHQVTFITTNGLKDPSLVNLTEIYVPSAYNYWKEANWGGSWGIFQYKMLTYIYSGFGKILELELREKSIQDVLFNQTYDVFITETNFYPTLIYLKQILKCPMVSIITLPPNRFGFEHIGDIVYPSFEAHWLLDFRSPRNFFERALSVYYYIFDFIIWKYKLIPEQKDIIKNYFGNKIKDYNMPLKVDLMLANINPILTGTRPNYPTVIEIGGINIPVKKGLSKELKQFLDSSKQGIIYFSLGSNVKSKFLPIEKRNMLIETFKKLPYNILWKYENDYLENKPDNVYIHKWLPQVDVLNHPNVKLFITQGGLQSSEETIHARVPIIGFPFMGDQFSNLDHLANNLGIGIKLNINTITVESFYKAIQTVMNNDSYTKRINEVADLFEDQPITPLNKAVYSIEYLIRHKNTKLLESPLLNMSFIEYACIDVIVVTLFIAIIFLYVNFRFLNYLFNLITCYTKKSNKIKQN